MTEMPKKTGRKFSEYRPSTVPLSSLASLHLLLTAVFFLFLSISVSLHGVPAYPCCGPERLSISVCLSISIFPSPCPTLTSLLLQPALLLSSVSSWPLSNHEAVHGETLPPKYPMLIGTQLNTRSQGDL